MLNSHYPRRVVIIDDNATDVMILQRALRELGLNVEIDVLEDGDKAVQYFENCGEESLPDLAVIDINLPKRDGIEVLRKCRFSPRLVQTKTLVFTSSNEPSDHNRAEMLGVDAYVRKPIKLDDFAAVARIIRELLDPVDAPPAA